MKELKAIIQPHMLAKVMDALHNFEHFPGATISDCQGQGRGRGKHGHFEATADTVFYAKKVILEIVCSDGVCADLVAIVRKAAHTGNPGDGIIFVSDLGWVGRIRTDQEQDDAV